MKYLKFHYGTALTGHSLRGECGLKFQYLVNGILDVSHSLRGECGLKLRKVGNTLKDSVSLSARRVWIEIVPRLGLPQRVSGHSLRGGCGLKFPK